MKFRYELCVCLVNVCNDREWVVLGSLIINSGYVSSVFVWVEKKLLIVLFLDGRVFIFKVMFVFILFF